ncbi:MAG: PGF-pre-PGF domain-containing protein [Candidatus Methanoperedens sp.]
MRSTVSTGTLNNIPATLNTQIPNNIPVQQPIGDKFVNENQALSFQIITTDADGDTITYSTNAAKGSLDPTTGVFTGTPTFADAGVYAWYFNSSDGFGGSVKETITVTVTLDTTAPASVTNLINITYAQTYITWTWTTPDTDIAKVMVYLDGIFKENVTSPTNYYNATNLIPDAEYTISTHAVDTSGNINQTWVNHTVRTAPLPIPIPVPVALTFVYPTPANNSILIQNYIPVNVTSNITNLQNITTDLYYRNGTLITSITNTTSPAYNNFTGLSEGVYMIQGTAFDLENNNTTEIIIITLVSPTPAPISNLNVSIISPQNLTYFKIDTDLNLPITVYANRTISVYNYSLDDSPQTSFINGTTTINPDFGLHKITVYLQDTEGIWGTDTQYFRVSNTLINSCYPDRYLAISNNSNVGFRINAIGDMNKTMYIRVTSPNGEFWAYNLPKVSDEFYFTPDSEGRYNVTFNTNYSECSSYFWSLQELTPMTFTVLEVNSSKNTDGINATVRWYWPGTSEILNLDDYQESFYGNTTFNFTLDAGKFGILPDVEFSQYNSSLVVRLNGLNLSSATNEFYNDIVEDPPEGFLLTYGIHTTNEFANANLDINYSNTGYSNEDDLTLYKCDNWDYANAMCLGSWVERTDAQQDKQKHLFNITVTNFSGFSIGSKTVTPFIPPPLTPPSVSGGPGGTNRPISATPFDNLDGVIEMDEDLLASVPASYIFDAPNFGITEVLITPANKFGSTSVRVEKLKYAPTIAGLTPPLGIVYEYYNVLIGVKQLESGEDIIDAFIGFKVDKSWLEENNIEEGSVSLLGWDGSTWVSMETSPNSIDDQFVYYVARINSFLPFAIVAESHYPAATVKAGRAPAFINMPIPKIIGSNIIMWVSILIGFILIVFVINRFRKYKKSGTVHGISKTVHGKSTEVMSEDADSWSNRGFGLYKDGKYDEAIKAYDKAIDIFHKSGKEKKD